MIGRLPCLIVAHAASISALTSYVGALRWHFPPAVQTMKPMHTYLHSTGQTDRRRARAACLFAVCRRRFGRVPPLAIGPAAARRSGAALPARPRRPPGRNAPNGSVRLWPASWPTIYRPRWIGRTCCWVTVSAHGSRSSWPANYAVATRGRPNCWLRPALARPASSFPRSPLYLLSDDEFVAAMQQSLRRHPTRSPQQRRVAAVAAASAASRHSDGRDLPLFRRSRRSTWNSSSSAARRIQRSRPPNWPTGAATHREIARSASFPGGHFFLFRGDDRATAVRSRRVNASRLAVDHCVTRTPEID